MRCQFGLLGRTLLILGWIFSWTLAPLAAARGDFPDDSPPRAQSDKNPKAAQGQPAAQHERYKLTLVKWTDKQGASRGGGGTVYQICASPDGKHVLIGGDSAAPLAMLWNIETGVMDRYFDIFDMGQDGSPIGVAIGPDGNKAAMATSRNKIYLVEIEHRNVINRVEGYEFVFRLKYSPDGKQLVLFESTGDLTFVNANTGLEAFRLSGHRKGGNDMSWSPDGKQLVSASGDMTARIWNVAERKQVHRLEHETWVWSVAFSPDGKLVATGTGGPIAGEPILQNYVKNDDNNIRLWDAATGKLLQTLGGHTDRIEGIQFVHGGKRLVSGSYDGSLRLWDVATGKELAKYEGKCAIYCLAIAGKDDTIIASGGSTREYNGHWRHVPQERVRVFKIEAVK
jgi:WD40 repeat protein